MTANSNAVSVDSSSPSSLLLDTAAASPCRTVNFVLPKEAIASSRWKTLSDEVREEVRLLLICCKRIHTAKNKTAECAALSASFRNRRGFSAISLNNKYYEFINSGGDWTVLVNKAKAGPQWWNTDEPTGLPEAFVQFWKKLCEDDQRTNAGAYAELLKIWRTKRDSKGNYYKAMPGYEAWPEPGPSGSHPRGWSDKNLFRQVAGSDFALTAARQGRAAASDHRRRVFTSREHLCVGQYYLFDDQEYDVRVNWLGNQRKAMRPLGLNALDLFSACCFAYALKPTLIGEDGAKQKLKERDMLWFVVNVLTSHGYRDDEKGTTLIVEHGTAAIREDFEARIAEATGGRVRVERSGINTAPAFAGLFESRAKGNPRFKAHLESFFNLVRNRMAMLPGATGKDRDHAPDEAHGLERYNNQLLKLYERLPQDRREQIQFPVLAWPQFQAFCLDLYQAINDRTDHELQGWERAGLVTTDWRMTPTQPWQAQQEFKALAPALQMALRDALALTPDLTRSRKLSPMEVWNGGRQNLTRLAPDLLPVLLGLEFGEERMVRGGYITVEDAEIDSEPMRFPAYPHANGQKFLTFLNPFRPDLLVLTDAQGRVEGVLRRQDAPSRDDLASVQRELGAARKEEATRLAELGLRHMDKAERKAEMHRHNAALTKSTTITPKERQQIDTAGIQPEDYENLFRNDSKTNTPQKPLFDEHDINAIL